MCPCGYYSTCPTACSPERIALLIAARERAWEDEELQKEYVKDVSEDNQGVYR